MPFFKEFSHHHSRIFVWRFDENDALPPDLIEPENFSRFENYKEKKLSEVLMVRQLLQKFLPGEKIFYQNDEPFLQSRKFQISISHSFPFAAVAFSERKIGIDLESFKPKIIRVKDKFIQPEEQHFIPENQSVEYLTVVWSVKESLYKMHHSKYWSLKKHYEVRPFAFSGEMQISCRVHDADFSDEYSAKVWVFDNVVLSLTF